MGSLVQLGASQCNEIARFRPSELHRVALSCRSVGEALGKATGVKTNAGQLERDRRLDEVSNNSDGRMAVINRRLRQPNVIEQFDEARLSAQRIPSSVDTEIQQ